MSNLSMIFTGIFILICPIFYNSCNGDQDHLPSITTVGKNTFGCLVNGQLFRTKGSLGQPNLNAEISTYRDTVGVSIYAGNSVSKKTLVISIYDSPGLQIGKSYDLKKSNVEVHYINYSIVSNACTYEDVQNGELIFSKFDINKKIISGTFRCDVSSANCNDSASITEGRFDIGEIIR